MVGGSDRGVALAGVRRGVVRKIRKMRTELMGTMTSRLAEMGLGTWEGERKLENMHARLVKEWEGAEKVYEE